MNLTRDIEHRLEMISGAIEALDADLAAGRLGVEEHGRKRAELEREAGRLFVAYPVAKPFTVGSQRSCTSPRSSSSR